MSGRGLGAGKLSRDRKGRYVLSWRDANRVQHRRVLSSDARIAERLRADIIRRRDLAERGLANEAGMDKPLSEIIAAFNAEMKATRAPRTARRFEDELRFAQTFLGPIRVRDVSVGAVMDWRRSRMAPKPPAPGKKPRKPASTRTVNLGAAVLKSALEWARRAGTIAANPLADLRPLPNPESGWKKRRRALSEDEIGRVLAAAVALDEARTAHWTAEKTIMRGTKGAGWEAEIRRPPVPQVIFWRAMLTLGLRHAEATSATWSDFDAEARVLSLRAEKTKARRSREVPVPPSLAEDLERLRAAQALTRGRPVAASDPIFASPRGAAWDAANVRRELAAVLKRAGIDPKDDRGRSVDVHSLRASASTRMLRRGIPVPVVMEIVAHRDARTLLRHYCDLRVEDAKAALDEVGAPEPTAPHQERARAAIGGDIPVSIREVPDDAEPEILSFSERSRPDSNGRPAVPKFDPTGSAEAETRDRKGEFPRESDDFSSPSVSPFE